MAHKESDKRHSRESKARRRATEKHGVFYETLKRRTPGLPGACESCGEDRVLEVAHKYAYKRRGAHATLANSEWPKMTWVLCPTCHRLLDKGIETSQELGLK